MTTQEGLVVRKKIYLANCFCMVTMPFFFASKLSRFFLDRISLDSCGILGGRPVK